MPPYSPYSCCTTATSNWFNVSEVARRELRDPIDQFADDTIALRVVSAGVDDPYDADSGVMCGHSGRQGSGERGQAARRRRVGAQNPERATRHRRGRSVGRFADAHKCSSRGSVEASNLHGATSADTAVQPKRSDSPKGTRTPAYRESPRFFPSTRGHSGVAGASGSRGDRPCEGLRRLPLAPPSGLEAASPIPETWPIGRHLPVNRVHMEKLRRSSGPQTLVKRRLAVPGEAARRISSRVPGCGGTRDLETRFLGPRRRIVGDPFVVQQRLNAPQGRGGAALPFAFSYQGDRLDDGQRSIACLQRSLVPGGLR